MDELLDEIDRLQRECRAAILAGDTKQAWRLWDQATRMTKELLMMGTLGEAIDQLAVAKNNLERAEILTGLVSAIRGRIPDE